MAKRNNELDEAAYMLRHADEHATLAWNHLVKANDPNLSARGEAVVDAIRLLQRELEQESPHA